MLKMKIINTLTYKLTKEDEQIIRSYAENNNVSLTDAVNRLENDDDFNFALAYNETEPLDIEETINIIDET